ncbi:two-component sensor histidine kinase [Niallia circulans]|jgi:two-component system, sensor histidine kinase YesM|uniref:sensor histidine kinase n=1 Tax=Niallia circulans TaxID=1397 RepID=UPI00201E03B0|nr:sensor histidine kinase [Niallia circulans]UQZ75805.1 two-component sensor histidine kinase [Niallia circulans]
MNKLSQWFKDLKYRRKILVICLLSSLLPVTALGSYCYFQIQKLLINREKEVLEETLHQAILSLDYKINSYNDAMNQIVWNQNIKSGLTANYDNNFDMYTMYRDHLKPLIFNVKNSQTDINRITVYSNNNTLFPHGTFLRPLTDVEKLEWFPEVIKNASAHLLVSSDKNSFEMASKIFDYNGNNINIVYMDIHYQSFFNPLSNLFENSYGLIILDEKKQPVYNHQNFNKNKQSYTLSVDELLNKINNGSLKNEYVFKSAKFQSNEWTAYLFRPFDIVSQSTSPIMTWVIIVIILCIFTLYLSIFFLSKVVVRPLELLAANMKQIEKGDLTVTVTHSSQDEIGDVIGQFGDMVHNLQEMINEVYKSKIAQQEYEMKALQAQINPHFFYNSLSLINSKAILVGQEDISEMAQLLSTFYRTTLNKGKNMITVKDEIENTISYMKIQQMMHSNSFDLSIIVDDQILGHTMINLLLQPLVENAINHGIDHKEDRERGIVTIIGKQADNDLLFTISDNGIGMEPEILETILTTKTTGYGVQNVHHRIKLAYGESYGLSYTSKLGKGTTVEVRIPKIL